MAFERARAKVIEFLSGGSSLPLWSVDSHESTRLDQAGALYSIAFMACEQVKMRTVGSLPVHVYRRGPEGREQTDHPLSKILAERWNPLMTAADGWHWLIQRRDTLGDAYVRVAYLPNGDPVAFYPIDAKVTPKLNIETHEAFYEIGEGDDLNPAANYPASKVLHFKTCFTKQDRVSGHSIADLAARAVGLTVDLEKFYQAMLENGSYFQGYFTTEEKVDQKEIDRIVAMIKSTRGIKNAGESRFFTRGVKWQANPVNVGDAGLIEQQTWHLQQVCRATGVPPQKVFDLSKSTYSNTEQGQLDFVQSLVTQEVSALEQVLKTVLDEMGDSGHFIKFDLNGLLRGAYKDRMEGYRAGVYAGFFLRNEVRSWEDLPKIEGLDRPLVPQAYGVVNEDGTITQANAATAYSLQPIIDNAEKRISLRVARDGVNQSTRDFATKVLLPIANACVLARVPFDLEETTERMITNAQMV